MRDDAEKFLARRLHVGAREKVVDDGFGEGGPGTRTGSAFVHGIPGDAGVFETLVEREKRFEEIGTVRHPFVVRARAAHRKRSRPVDRGTLVKEEARRKTFQGPRERAVQGAAALGFAVGAAERGAELFALRRKLGFGEALAKARVVHPLAKNREVAEAQAETFPDHGKFQPGLKGGERRKARKEVQKL